MSSIKISKKASSVTNNTTLLALYMLVPFIFYGGAINFFLQSKITYKSYIGTYF
jgi:hypothetical protein